MEARENKAPYRPPQWLPCPVASGGSGGLSPALPAFGELHLWRIDLDHPAPIPEGALSADEEGRAARLLDPAARQRFRRVRWAVRAILGGYLNCAPAALRFGVQGQGKPFPIDPPRPIAFNLSHSRGLALLGVTAGTEVGVDLEKMEARGDLLRVARRILLAEEVAELAALPQAERPIRFFQHWTRLEARVKARGEGIFNPGDTPLPAKAQLLEPEPGWVAAVAGDNLGEEPAQWQYLDFVG